MSFDPDCYKALSKFRVSVCLSVRLSHTCARSFCFVDSFLYQYRHHNRVVRSFLFSDIILTDTVFCIAFVIDLRVLLRGLHGEGRLLRWDKRPRDIQQKDPVCLLLVSTHPHRYVSHQSFLIPLSLSSILQNYVGVVLLYFTTLHSLQYMHMRQNMT